MKKKLSVKVIMSLILSAVLFCMPIGAFMANSGNTVSVQAQDTDTAENESETETPSTGTEEESESEQENSTVSGNDIPTPECTCKEKCSQYSVDKECEVCKEDYSLCEYVNSNVKITINTPTGWHNDTTKVHILVEDVAKSGNFTVKSVQAKVAQNGSWTDITEDMYVEISENCTVYVLVTDQKGNTYEKNRYIKCFDFTKPTLNAAVGDGLLSVQAHDTDSGIKAVYVNGYEFTELTNGVLNIRLQQFDAGYQYFTISAMDNAGNMSEVYKTANPYYTDPEAEDSNESDPAKQLPVSAQASKPSSATGQVTEHMKTDSEGNTTSETSLAEQKKAAMQEADASEQAENNAEQSENGKEFYTIQTASDKVFYLIIDRDGDEKMVYFLTEISENDLLNTTTDNSETLPKNSAALESAIPVSTAHCQTIMQKRIVRKQKNYRRMARKVRKKVPRNRKNSPHSPIIRWEPISCLASLQLLASEQATISRWSRKRKSSLLMKMMMRTRKKKSWKMRTKPRTQRTIFLRKTMRRTNKCS